MSDHGSPSEDDHNDHLAVEYVLGVLDAEARSRAAERLANEPAFRAEVEAWERRMAPLMDEVAPVTPPADLWARVAASIAPASNVIPLKARSRVWDQVGVWRAATGGLAAAAAGLVIVLAVRPPAAPAPSSPPSLSPQSGGLTAKLATPGGKVLFVALLDRSQDRVTVVPVSAVKAGGRAAELWVIAVGGAPKPVGLLDTGKSLSMTSSMLSGANSHAVFAVSLEPAGGSTTGAPTGPGIATGALEIL